MDHQVVLEEVEQREEEKVEEVVEGMVVEVLVVYNHT